MKLVYSVAEVAEALGVSRNTVYRLIEDAELKAMNVRRRRVVTVAELDRYVAAQQAAA